MTSSPGKGQTLAPIAASQTSMAAFGRPESASDNQNFFQ